MTNLRERAAAALAQREENARTEQEAQQREADQRLIQTAAAKVAELLEVPANTIGVLGTSWGDEEAWAFLEVDNLRFRYDGWESKAVHLMTRCCLCGDWTPTERVWSLSSLGVTLQRPWDSAKCEACRERIGATQPTQPTQAPKSRRQELAGYLEDISAGDPAYGLGLMLAEVVIALEAIAAKLPESPQSIGMEAGQ